MTNHQIRTMAETSTILQCPVGSTIHGLHLPGTDDRDEMGICVESMSASMGLKMPFEQYIYRTAAERESKHDAPSQPGDLDLTIYSLRKWLRLALQGNPTVLTPLFVRSDRCTVSTQIGRELQQLAPRIISKQAGRRYLGYMEAQRQRLMGERGQKRVRRPELEAAHGYDTKYAMHVMRLGIQGWELMTSGFISFPMSNSCGWRDYVMAVRKGEVPLQEVLTICGELERAIKDLLTTSALPDDPDIDYMESWMLNVYREAWETI